MTAFIIAVLALLFAPRLVLAVVALGIIVVLLTGSASALLAIATVSGAAHVGAGIAALLTLYLAFDYLVNERRK